MRFICALLAAVAIACERESRPIDKLPAAAQQPPAPTDFYAGPPPPRTAGVSPFQENAWGMAEGKRLFTAFNCSGCHANGGGGMGPALMDDRWLYGSHPASIFFSIVEGRPNGMPSWRNKIPDAQVWQLVAFVQSMSGQAAQPAAPSRSDHMRYGTPENMRHYQAPVQTGRP
jgi:cytochrome c oxidase cbb3-type subunit III